MTTFNWRGHQWIKQTWGGNPQYNGQWSPDNVVLNQDDTITLKVTNPSGSEPIGASFESTRGGWGYGTYVAVVEGDLDDIPRSIVFGNLFTYDNGLGTGSSANELDLGEISHWGKTHTTQPQLSATVWHADSNGDGNPEFGHAYALPLPKGMAVHTYVCTWTPEGCTFRTYKGRGMDGELVAEGTVTEDIPVPANEVILFNMWVTDQGRNDPSTTPPFEVTILDFSFAPWVEEPELPPVEPPKPEPPVEPEPEPPVEPAEPKPKRRCEACGRCQRCGRRRGYGHKRWCRRLWRRQKARQS